jgi:hypothetical protein
VALLSGIDKDGEVSLIIAPLRLGAPSCADAVTVEVTFACLKHSITGTYQLTDDDFAREALWLIAQAFCQVRAIAQADSAVNLWRLNVRSPKSFYQNTEWLHVVLWGHGVRRVAIRLFSQSDTDPASYYAGFINTSLGDAEQFGLELEREIANTMPDWWVRHTLHREEHEKLRLSE